MYPDPDTDTVVLAGPGPGFQIRRMRIRSEHQGLKSIYESNFSIIFNINYFDFYVGDKM